MGPVGFLSRSISFVFHGARGSSESASDTSQAFALFQSDADLFPIGIGEAGIWLRHRGRWLWMNQCTLLR